MVFLTVVVYMIQIKIIIGSYEAGKKMMFASDSVVKSVKESILSKSHMGTIGHSQSVDDYCLFCQQNGALTEMDDNKTLSEYGITENVSS
jgi:hypothetical protein